MLSACHKETLEDPWRRKIQCGTWIPLSDWIQALTSMGMNHDEDTERKGKNMMSDLTMLTISVAINIAIIMLAMFLRDTWNVRPTVLMQKGRTGYERRTDNTGDLGCHIHRNHNVGHALHCRRAPHESLMRRR